MVPQFNDDSEYEEAWAEESWTAHTGQPVAYGPHIQIDECWFVDGEHYAGRYCPHNEDGTEQGEMPKGWTVLNS